MGKMKRLNAAALAAMILMTASCSDISRPTVEAYSVELPSSGTEPQETTASRDDGDWVDIIADPDGDGFTTTGPEETEAPRTAKTRKSAKETTFPKQTSETDPETVIAVEDTSAPPETTTTTAAPGEKVSPAMSEKDSSFTISSAAATASPKAVRSRVSSRVT